MIHILTEREEWSNRRREPRKEKEEALPVELIPTSKRHCVIFWYALCSLRLVYFGKYSPHSLLSILWFKRNRWDRPQTVNLSCLSFYAPQLCCDSANVCTVMNRIKCGFGSRGFVIFLSFVPIPSVTREVNAMEALAASRKIWIWKSDDVGFRINFVHSLGEKRKCGIELRDGFVEETERTIQTKACCEYLMPGFWRMMWIMLVDLVGNSYLWD